jgi:ABC-type transport system involved in cytochrome c biogenesis permease subunit
MEARMRTATKFVLAAAALAVAGIGATLVPASAGENAHAHDAAPAASRPRFDKDVVDLFARLPVQDGGRVKPLSTFAGFTLLALNGRREAKTADGARLDPTEWLMTCVFFPEEAIHDPCFLVENAEVLDLAGLAHEGKSRRDRYAFAELAPARDRIFQLASQYAQVEEKDRDLKETQLLHLATNLATFERLAGLVGVAASPPTAAGSPALAMVFGKDARPRIADMVDHALEIGPWLDPGETSPDTMGGGAQTDAHLRAWIEDVVSASRGVALIPPGAAAAANAEWLSPSDVVEKSLFHRESMPRQAAALRELDAMAAARDDAPEFRRHAQEFSSSVVATAQARGEYAKIPLETAFYRAEPFYWAQVVFVLGFVVAAFSWIKSAKGLTRAATVAVLVATALLAAGITMRCVIRGRPPVSTLYESILFTTGVAVVASMVAEYVNRRGIALALATVLGSAGMFLANKYEMQERVDTMPSLVAVLDTNFWLASHVTTVTIGYGAGLLAGAVAHVYVLGKLFGLKKNDPGFYKSLSTMTYGMLCFGLLFSVVGTVLGGIWANESWGRFWGWDPKENGALTIVLWELIVLHARLAGYLRDFGVAMASVFGASVVASSWWGVNLLGVGLHSYGFTNGVLVALLVFYGVEALVLLAGGVHWWLAPRTAPAPCAAARPVPPQTKVEAVSGGVS